MNKLDILKYSGEEFVSLFVVDRSSPLASILSDLKYLGFNPIVFGKIIDNKAIVYKNQERHVKPKVHVGHPAYTP